MGDSNRFRNTTKDQYTEAQEARCTRCKEVRVFFRHPEDKNCGIRGHKKHMRCYFCLRMTVHITLGALQEA